MRATLLRLATIGLIAAASQMPFAAQAHHRSGHNGGPPHSRESDRSDEASEIRSRNDSDRELAAPLTTAQKTLLSELLRDTNYPDAVVIDGDTRAEIQSQIDSLPPGIQRRLARGRSLPPGIAKKVSLPTAVNEQLDLNEDLQVIVVGRDVAVVDPVTGLIIDILREVLL